MNRHPSGRACAGAMPAVLMAFVRLAFVELRLRSMRRAAAASEAQSRSVSSHVHAA